MVELFNWVGKVVIFGYCLIQFVVVIIVSYFDNNCNRICMFSFLFVFVIGVINFILFGINILFWCILLYILVVLKLVVFYQGFWVLCIKLIIVVVEVWVVCNGVWMKLIYGIEWDVIGVEELKWESWYLVLSNYQSWVDILVMQWVFNCWVLFLKFFLKQQLIWVLVIGLVWWGFDFLFMKWYICEYLLKYLEKCGEDLCVIWVVCEKFCYIFVSVMNFVEGIWFIQVKYDKQKLFYQYFLVFKVGGVVFVLDVMGDVIEMLVDVIIVYLDGVFMFWDFFCGWVKQIWMEIYIQVILGYFKGWDYFVDVEYCWNVKDWLVGLWQDKDVWLMKMFVSCGE